MQQLFRRCRICFRENMKRSSGEINVSCIRIRARDLPRSRARRRPGLFRASRRRCRLERDGHSSARGQLPKQGGLNRRHIRQVEPSASSRGRTSFGASHRPRRTGSRRTPFSGDGQKMACASTIDIVGWSFLRVGESCAFGPIWTQLWSRNCSRKIRSLDATAQRIITPLVSRHRGGIDRPRAMKLPDE